MDHLERVGKGNELWKFQSKEDICEVDVRQVIAVEPVYEWDILNVRI